MKYFVGALQVLASGICFGFLGIFARLGQQQGLDVGELLALRFSLAALLLWLGLYLFQPKLIRLSVKQILISLSLGAFGYAVFSTFYFKAIEGISVPLAAMLLFTFPLFVNLGAHFVLKERMTKLQVACLILATLGLVLLLWGDFSVQKISAIFFGLGSGLTYSIYVLVSGRVQAQVAPLSSSLYVITATALVLDLYNQPNIIHVIGLGWKAWALVAGIAVVSTIAPLTLFLAGLQKMKSGKAAVIVMIEPVTAAVAANFLLNEILSPLQLAGGALVLIGVLLDAFYRPETKNQTENQTSDRREAP